MLQSTDPEKLGDKEISSGHTWICPRRGNRRDNYEYRSVKIERRAVRLVGRIWDSTEADYWKDEAFLVWVKS